MINTLNFIHNLLTQKKFSFYSIKSVVIILISLAHSRFKKKKRRAFLTATATQPRLQLEFVHDFLQYQESSQFKSLVDIDSVELNKKLQQLIFSI